MKKNCMSKCLLLRIVLKKNNWELKDFISVLNENIFPNLYKMMKVALMLPVSTATRERSFLVMMRIKSWLCSLMTDDRFTDLSILNIESKLVSNIDINKIVDTFAEKNNRKFYLKLFI
jgi:hypothetical protein